MYCSFFYVNQFSSPFELWGGKGIGIVGCNLVPINKTQYFLHIHAGCRSLLSRSFLSPLHQSLLGSGELPQSSSLSPWKVCCPGSPGEGWIRDPGADWQCPCCRTGMSHIPGNWGACEKWPPVWNQEVDVWGLWRLGRCLQMCGSRTSRQRTGQGLPVERQ